MVAALPGNIKLKLDQTLAQWRHWDCDPPLSSAPSILRVLPPGLSNFSVLVEAGRPFVVRIDGVNPAVHGLNRQGEWHSLHAAHDAGLAPRPRYFNPDLGSLVCDYLAPDAHQPLAVADIADLLRGIHRLPARHHRLDLPDRVLSYEKRLAHRDVSRTVALTRYRNAITAILADTGAIEQPLVLCHHDLLRANRLYHGGRLYAIDWEYSAMGSPWYDLAVVAAGDALGNTGLDGLLESYLDRPAHASERELVMQYGCVYRYLELLWYLAQAHPALDAAGLESKLERLATSLDCTNRPAV